VNFKSKYYKDKGKLQLSMMFDTPLFLTGFGRCIQYEIIREPDGCTKERRFVNMKEGEFENGAFKGYGRLVDNSGKCKVGFWDTFVPNSYNRRKTITEGTSTISVPFGKWAWYNEDGNYVADEGFYVGI